MARFKSLSRLLERFKGLFDPQKCCLAVELSEDCIKIVETGIVQGKIEVSRLIKKQIDGKDKVAAARAIKEVFGTARIARPCVRLNIPRHLVTVRLLKLPSVDDEEIGRIVKIESLKHVPYADEKITCGHRVIERFPDGYSLVLIAVAQAENIQSLVKMFDEANVVVESAILGSESLLLWYALAGLDKTDTTVLLLNLDEDHIDIDVISGDKLVFTRGVLLGIHEGNTEEKILEQIKLSTSVFQRESGKSIEKILLCGPAKKSIALKESLQSHFLIGLDAVNQMANITQGQEAQTQEAEEGSFVELLGLALKFEDAKIDLLPETIQEANRFTLVKRYAAMSLVMLTLIVAFLLGVVFKKLHDERTTISRIDAEFQKVGPELKNAKKMVKQMELVTAHKNDRPLAIDLVREIFKTTPSNISLAMVECETDKAMTLRGTAPSLSDVFKYASALQQSTCFNNVKVKYANKRVGQGAQLADFEITTYIRKAKGLPNGRHVSKKSE